MWMNPASRSAVLDGFRPKSGGGRAASRMREENFSAGRLNLASGCEDSSKWVRASALRMEACGSGQEQIGKPDHDGSHPGGDQDVIGPQAALDVE